jgi:hypothetical protein
MKHIRSARFAVAATLAFSVHAGSAVATPANGPPVVARAEQCLRDNVATVTAVESDLQSAASFLVTFVCAREVAGAVRYERSRAAVSSFVALVSSSPASLVAASRDAANTTTAAAQPKFAMPTVDPETGEIIMPPQPPGTPANFFAPMMPQLAEANATLFGSDAAPVALRQLAGALVLEARSRRPSHSH